MLEPDPPHRGQSPTFFRALGLAPDPDVPEVKPHWFFAIDNPIDMPKSPVRPGMNSPKSKSSTTWLPFSQRDSDALEAALESQDDSTRVFVNEDRLYEVKVHYRTIAPAYWDGAVYPVRRATWFMQIDGTKWIPCEEVLAQQIEAGYRKYKPFRLPPAVETQLTINRSKRSSFPLAKTERSVASSATVEEAKLEMTLAGSTVEKQWNLLGPYLGQYVVYTGENTGWLLSNSTSSKLAKSIITRLTNKQNLGGTRLLRGYAQLEKQFKGIKGSFAQSRSSSPDPDSSIKGAAEDDQDRQIDHIVFVVHGAGQKVTGRGFIESVNELRKAIKNVFPVAIASTSNPDRPNGIQVLPVLWRKQVTFALTGEERHGMEADLGLPEGDDGCPSLDELTVDSVPNIRSMVSNVIMDIPLYMTPIYREQMTTAISKMINSMFLQFLVQHPDFLERKGKVSIIGHSLGSLVAFDMLSLQPIAKPPGYDELSAALKIPQSIRKYKASNSLVFPVQNLFMMGSPVGVMLLLKGYRIGSRRSLNTSSPSFSPNKPPRSTTFCYPSVENLYNIFHKSDPVAYRLEPLIARQYGAQLKPEMISNMGDRPTKPPSQNNTTGITNRAGAMYESFKIGLTTNLVMRGLGLSRQQMYEDLYPKEEESEATQSGDIQGDKGENPILKGTLLQEPPVSGRSHGRSSSDSAVVDLSSRTPPTSISITNQYYSEGARRLRMLNVTGRVDYCVQETTVDSNPYWSAFTAHTQYWPDDHVVAFLIREIYR